MLKSLSLFTIFSIGIAGLAAAEQPFDINVKFKVEGAIERVDMGVYAYCNVYQRFPDDSLSSVKGATQLLEPGELFSAQSGDGTISGTVKVTTDDTFNLSPGNPKPTIRCSLMKGVAPTDPINIVGLSSFGSGQRLHAPAGPGSCVRVFAEYDLDTQSPIRETEICD